MRHTDGTDVQKIECSEENMANVEKLLKENGPNIQEAIYQLFLLFPPNKRAKIFAKLGFLISHILFKNYIPYLISNNMLIKVELNY
jgi:hypothetical protein